MVNGDGHVGEDLDPLFVCCDDLEERIEISRCAPSHSNGVSVTTKVEGRRPALYATTCSQAASRYVTMFSQVRIKIKVAHVMSGRRGCDLFSRNRRGKFLFFPIFISGSG